MVMCMAFYCLMKMQMPLPDLFADELADKKNNMSASRTAEAVFREHVFGHPICAKKILKPEVLRGGDNLTVSESSLTEAHCSTTKSPAI